MSKFKIGEIYHTNKYGDYRIIEKIDSTHYVIEFIKTGYKKKISRASMAEGTIRDPYFPIYYNIACLGDVNTSKYRKELNVWRFMLARCYDEKHNNYKTYGAKGVRVCDRWLCFENFLIDLPKIKGYDEEKFRNKEIVLDKDIDFRLSSNKMYCLEYCRFISQKDNFQEMLTRKKQETSSRYIGVSKLKDGKWQASISYKNKNIYIGRYKTEIEAHEAYKEKYCELYGKETYC